MGGFRCLELNDFHQQIELQSVEFTAAGFFQLERSIVIRYLYVVSQYFVAFIQILVLSN